MPPYNFYDVNLGFNPNTYRMYNQARNATITTPTMDYSLTQVPANTNGLNNYSYNVVQPNALDSTTTNNIAGNANVVGLVTNAVGRVGDMITNIDYKNDVNSLGRGDIQLIDPGSSIFSILSNDIAAQNAKTIKDNTEDYSNADINTIANSTGNDYQDYVNYTSDGWGVLGQMASNAAKASSLGFDPLSKGILAGVGGIYGWTKGVIADTKNKKLARQVNELISDANQNMLASREAGIERYNQNLLRNNMRNYFDEGGYLENNNGITEFNVGNTHEQNPYEGIQQGIASDGLPNLVEENERRYKDYIYSARLKPSKALLKQYNLPEKYVGLTFAEIVDKLQKESKDRPNDPISANTLDEMMTRLAGAQEEHKAKASERKLARELDKLSDEEKALLMSSLVQPMAQQEGIDLNQPIYAKGGKIFIKPENRGKFTALKKRTGKSASWFKAHGTPAQKKMATFALNAKKWHHANGGHLAAYGLNLDEPPYDKYYPTGLGIDYVSDPEPYTGPDFWSLAVPTYNTIGAPYATDLENPAVLYSANPVTQNLARPVIVNTETPSELPEDYLALRPDTTEPVKAAKKRKVRDTVNTKLLADNLSASLRYAPAVGSVLGALEARLQPKDYYLANAYRDLASQLTPISGTYLSNYRRYNPYDINLGDAINVGLTARALDNTRGRGRSENTAAILDKAKETSAARNLQWQQANEQNRLTTDTYNLGIDRTNAEIARAYDQINQDIKNRRLNMLASAAQAQDESNALWAQNVNATTENMYNQLGNVGRDTWNRNQRDVLLEALGAEGIKELMKTADGRVWLISMGYKG